LWIVIGINAAGTHLGAKVNLIFMVIKLTAAISIAVVGLAVLGSILFMGAHFNSDGSWLWKSQSQLV